MKYIILFLIVFPSFCFSQTDYKTVTFQKAKDEIYAEILQAENSIKNTDSQYWVRTEKIVCLSGIIPKKIDHQYTGLSYKPTFEEIERWKKWFRKNKKNLKYTNDKKSGNRIIVFENLDGEIKRSDCIYQSQATNSQ